MLGFLHIGVMYNLLPCLHCCSLKLQQCRQDTVHHARPGKQTTAMHARGCITPHPESSATTHVHIFIFQAKHPPLRHRQEARSKQPSPTMSCLSHPSTMACHCTVYSYLRQANLEAAQWQKKTRGACPKNEKKNEKHTHLPGTIFWKNPGGAFRISCPYRTALLRMRLRT